MNDSRLDQLDVSVLHKHHNCAWRLPEPIRAQLHQDVTPVPMCDLMGAPCSHESSTFVFVCAKSRIRTVLLHLPGHLLVLGFLWDFHLPRVPVLWLENRRKSSPRHVCGCSMRVLRLLLVFLSFPRCSCDTAQRFSRPSISLKRTGCRDIGNHGRGTTQDKHTRLLLGSRQEAPVSPDSP